MKRVLLAASAVFILAAPGFSFAQDDHHHAEGGHPGGGAPHQSAPAPRPAAPQAQRPSFPGGQGGYRPQPGQNGFHGPTFPGGQGGYRPQPGQAGFQGPTFPGGQGGYRPQPGQNGYHQPDSFGRPNGGPHGFNPGGPMRSGGQGFGYGGRQYFRYQAAPYRFPGGYYGWANHAWRRGEWLPSVFITSAYFINDWSRLRPLATRLRL